jgi:hypothetical protein
MLQPKNAKIQFKSTKKIPSQKTHPKTAETKEIPRKKIHHKKALPEVTYG